MYTPALPFQFIYRLAHTSCVWYVQSRGHFSKFLCSILNQSRFPFEVNSIYFVLPLVCFGEPRPLISGKYSNFCTQ